MTKLDFDDVLEEIGPLGPYTLRVVILIGLAIFPVGYNALANVFLAAQPTFRCSNGDEIANGTQGM